MADNGNDILTGTEGDDTLSGFGGDDTLNGLGGDNSTKDVIDLTGYGISSYSELQSNMTLSGPNNSKAVINFDAQNHVTVNLYFNTQLTAGNFLFHT
jgi:RTX calcium-binding nonapeptide repeat (4 copies)